VDVGPLPARPVGLTAHTGYAMADIEHWVRTARDGTIIRRATLTALLVGTILTAVNRGSESLRAGIEPGHILPIAFYLVPFVVSLASSVSATCERAPQGSGYRGLPEVFATGRLTRLPAPQKQVLTRKSSSGRCRHELVRGGAS